MVRIAFAVLLACAGAVGLAAPARYTVQLPATAELPDPGQLPMLTANAFQIALDLDIARDGSWMLDRQGASWEAMVEVSGADYFYLRVTEPVLPAGAELRFVDPVTGKVHWLARKETLSGPFTTPRLPGDSVLLQLSAPHRLPAQLRLRFPFVYRNFPSPSSKVAAGACHIDVSCSEGLGRENQIAATVMLIILHGPLVYTCTATLLNNTANDFAPYLLTAQHCGISSESASDLTISFAYQSRACASGEEPGLTGAGYFTTGATLIAELAEADFTLLAIGDNAQPFVIPAAFQAYWSGWSRSTRPPAQGFAIHHPRGAAKAISLFSAPARIGSLFSSAGHEVAGWLVRWTAGTTEVGSSGAGLFDDTSGHLVGQLLGGSASCRRPDLADLFSRFDRAWDADPDPGKQLRYWLDPLQLDPLDWDGLSRPTSTPASSANSVQQADSESGGTPGWILLGLGVCSVIRRYRRSARSPAGGA